MLGGQVPWCLLVTWAHPSLGLVLFLADLWELSLFSVAILSVLRVRGIPLQFAALSFTLVPGGSDKSVFFGNLLDFVCPFLCDQSSQITLRACAPGPGSHWVCSDNPCCGQAAPALYPALCTQDSSGECP